jgi:hypothetical protein
MEILNRNQRTAARWRLIGLYSVTIVIMGIIAVQSWTSYRNRAEAQYQAALKAAVENEKKNCEAIMASKVISAFREAAGSITTNIKQASEKPVANPSVQGSVNTVNDNVNKVKAVQSAVKNIESILPASTK